MRSMGHDEIYGTRKSTTREASSLPQKKLKSTREKVETFSPSLLWIRTAFSDFLD
jgi:hypothetical protein